MEKEVGSLRHGLIGAGAAAGGAIDTPVSNVVDSSARAVSARARHSR